MPRTSRSVDNEVSGFAGEPDRGTTASGSGVMMGNQSSLKPRSGPLSDPVGIVCCKVKGITDAWSVVGGFDLMSGGFKGRSVLQWHNPAAYGAYLFWPKESLPRSLVFNVNVIQEAIKLDVNRRVYNRARITGSLVQKDAEKLFVLHLLG